MNPTPTISLCMIVKDEESYLAQCFDSVKDIVDEIIVVDTGSTDNTQVICESYQVRYYSYSWEDDFAKARNYSLSFAQSDWILILDGDEIMGPIEKQDFLALLQHTTVDSFLVTIHNYVGQLEEGEYSIHHSLRLFRNHHGLCFQGTIHEQVVYCDSPEQPLSCEFSHFIISHYGYLAKVIDAKAKHSRNLPLLQKQLEADPNNAFVLFNLGNEYAVLGQYEQAINLYQRSILNLKEQAAFKAYLHFRMVMCYSCLNRNLEAVNLGLELQLEMPDFTDIVYCVGLAYYHMHQYTKALQTMDQCIRMGPSPIHLTFLHGSATFLPYQIKAEIYRRLMDLESAIDCLTKAYQYKKGNTVILYEIGHLLNQCYQEKDMVVSNLIRISNQSETSNLYECVDILIEEQLYRSAASLLSTLDSDDVTTILLKGKLQFYHHEFSSAAQHFHLVLSLSPHKKQDLEALIYLYIIAILTHSTDLPILLLALKSKASALVYQVYQNIYDMQFPQENSYEILTILIEFLEKLLKLQAFEQFETYLTLLDQVACDNTLLELGKLYERCGYERLAQATYSRSLKELNIIDAQALDYLASGLYHE